MRIFPRGGAMDRNSEHTEQLILHAIEVWERQMKHLFQYIRGKPCPYCPKRFIYGCFCSFERKFVETTIDRMVDKGILRKRLCENNPDEFYVERML